MSIKVTWHDFGREPRCAPNPDFPAGIDLDIAQGRPSCKAILPYPAKRCGWYHVLCENCGLAVVVTTAGRADDPRSLVLPCKRKLQ